MTAMIKITGLSSKAVFFRWKAVRAEQTGTVRPGSPPIHELFPITEGRAQRISVYEREKVENQPFTQRQQPGHGDT